MAFSKLLPSISEGELIVGKISEKEIFYKTLKKCLEAVIKHSENYAIAAKEMAKKRFMIKDVLNLKRFLKFAVKFP